MKDTTYGNVCEESLRSTKTFWTAEDPVKHGHAPVGKKQSMKKLKKNNNTIGTETCQEAG